MILAAHRVVRSGENLGPSGCVRKKGKRRNVASERCLNTQTEGWHAS